MIAVIGVLGERPTTMAAVARLFHGVTEGEPGRGQPALSPAVTPAHRQNGQRRLHGRLHGRLGRRRPHGAPPDRRARRRRPRAITAALTPYPITTQARMLKPSRPRPDPQEHPPCHGRSCCDPRRVWLHPYTAGYSALDKAIQPQGAFSGHPADDSARGLLRHGSGRQSH
jgi:hypothetical protein